MASEPQSTAIAPNEVAKRWTSDWCHFPMTPGRADVNPMCSSRSSVEGKYSGIRHPPSAAIVSQYTQQAIGRSAAFPLKYIPSKAIVNDNNNPSNARTLSIHYEINVKPTVNTSPEIEPESATLTFLNDTRANICTLSPTPSHRHRSKRRVFHPGGVFLLFDCGPPPPPPSHHRLLRLAPHYRGVRVDEIAKFPWHAWVVC